MSSTQLITDRQKEVEVALNRLSSIDFAGVRMKLGDPTEGQGWDEAMLSWAEQEYRRFLALTFAYPDLTIVPDKAVDVFWHQHIVDTRAYAKDTEAVFGFFLHHFPYLGTRGPADKEKLTQCYSETRALYEMHFPTNDKESSMEASSCGGGRCSSCAVRTN
jgi:Uncharacterized conserved protein